MEKKVILCAMESYKKAQDFMRDIVVESRLPDTVVYEADYNRLILRTDNTETRFTHPYMPEAWLCGIRADAVFGLEPWKGRLRPYLKQGRVYNLSIGLVDYIVHVECEAKKEQTKKVYITSASSLNANNAYQEALRKYFDYLYNNGIEPGQLAEAKRKADEERYVQIDNFLTKELWTKMNPYMKKTYPVIPEIKTVYFNNPVTVVLWTDGTKTIVRCQEGDVYDPEKGLAMAVTKKLYGNKDRYYDIFKKWIPGDKEE